MQKLNRTTNYCNYKQIIAILTCLTFVLLLLCACNTTGDAELNRNRQINSINHRGYVDAPENTLAAFRLSKDKGFDMVECDVRFTKDNVAVLLHDKYVNRTAHGGGSITNMTYEQVRKLDFGSCKSILYVVEHISTFAEFISLFAELDFNQYVDV